MNDYAVANKLVSEPVFAWWVPYCLKKRDPIIAVVNDRINKCTHNYGIEGPTTGREEYAPDKKNWNYYYSKSIMKEMKNVSIAFKNL